MIMNKNERPSFLRGRGAAVGLVICFVAVIAIAGAYTFNNYKKQMNEQVAKAEDQAEELTEDKSKEAATDDIVLPEEDDKEEDGRRGGFSVRSRGGRMVQRGQYTHLAGKRCGPDRLQHGSDCFLLDAGAV